MTAPRRRLFRFSLRTLFVVVTVTACWLGYSLNWIRQRHSLLRGEAYVYLPGTFIDPVSQLPCSLTQEAPRMLSMLGENGQGYVYMAYDVSDAEVERVRRLFPEAEVERVDSPATQAGRP